jgi:predicted O-methyltransferase YrrM
LLTDGIEQGYVTANGPATVEEDSMTVESLLVELEMFGKQNDSTHSERPKRMLNISRATGEFLTVLVKATSSRRVLEIGTSNGYSTLWLARGVKETGGAVTTVEFSEYKTSLAKVNFERSGLNPFIDQICDDAGNVLARAPDAHFDFIFLDSERSKYPTWWPHLNRVLRPGGLLVVDNANSHSKEMAPFVALVEADGQFTTSLVPVGNGEYLAVRCPR